jgi:hypothetical protein
MNTTSNTQTPATILDLEALMAGASVADIAIAPDFCKPASGVYVFRVIDSKIDSGVKNEGTVDAKPWQMLKVNFAVQCLQLDKQDEDLPPVTGSYYAHAWGLNDMLGLGRWKRDLGKMLGADEATLNQLSFSDLINAENKFAGMTFLVHVKASIRTDKATGKDHENYSLTFKGNADAAAAAAESVGVEISL